MAESMHVSPGLLAAAAAQADTASQTVLARHCAAADAVGAALCGWVGASRSALAATADRWAQGATALSLRVHAQAEALRVAGLTFAEMDARHAGLIGGPGRP